jgi:uncharacterized membrane-anchored protein YhcB (DUF1043 family)
MTSQTAEEIMQAADAAYDQVYQVYSKAAGALRFHSEDEAVKAAFRAAKAAKYLADEARQAEYARAYAIEAS